MADECPLCHKQGEGIAKNYKKGHYRADGIVLESGLSYCDECIKTPECEVHWKQWWKDQWAKCEAKAEKNWQEHGVYTNVGGSDGPSRYFGYVKLKDGRLRPYRYEHPENNRDVFDRDCNDKADQLTGLHMPDEKKFERYLNFLRNYKPQDEDIEHRVAAEIKRIEERGNRCEY